MGFNSGFKGLTIEVTVTSTSLKLNCETSTACLLNTAFGEDKRMGQFHTSPILATLVFWVMVECSLAGGYRCF